MHICLNCHLRENGRNEPPGGMSEHGEVYHQKGFRKNEKEFSSQKLSDAQVRLLLESKFIRKVCAGFISGHVQISRPPYDFYRVKGGRRREVSLGRVGLELSS